MKQWQISKKRQKKVNALILILFVGILLRFSRYGVFAYFTDYEMKSLTTQSGIALELSGDAGIENVTQTGYVVEEDDVGWYRKGMTASVNAVLKAGYSFEGWYNDTVKISDASSADWTMQQYTQLTAKSKVDIYTLTYMSNGEQVLVNEGICNYTVEDTVTLSTSSELGLKEQGYTFDGWYDNASFTGSPITTIPKGSTGDKIFYAKWKPIEYAQFSFEGNYYTYEVGMNWSEFCDSPYNRCNFSISGFYVVYDSFPLYYYEGHFFNQIFAQDLVRSGVLTTNH